MIDPVIHWVLALCLAGMWLGASVSKLRNRSDFYTALNAYRLLPRRSLPAAVFAIPLLELVIAVNVLFTPVRPGAALLSAAVLTAYALAMATNLLRGRVDIDCGCTPGRKQLLSWSLVVRNMILAASSLALLVPVSARTMVLADVLVAVLVAGFTAVMWTLVPMVRRNSLSLVKGVRQ